MGCRQITSVRFFFRNPVKTHLVWQKITWINVPGFSGSLNVVLVLASLLFILFNAGQLSGW